MSFTMEELKGDLNLMNARKEQAYQTFYQILGAINILEQQIQKLNSEEEKKKQEKIPPISENEMPKHTHGIF